MLLIRLLISYPKYLILLVGLVLAICGSVSIMNTNSTPAAQTMTIAQFESQRPNSGWYHVTGAVTDLGGAMGVNSSGHKAAEGETPVAIIAPVWSATDRNGTKPSVFVKTSNPALIAAAHPHAASETLAFSGLIEDSGPNDNTVASAMDKEGGDVVVLDDGSAPTPIALGVLMVVAGLAIVAGGIVLLVKKIPLWGRHGAPAYQAPRPGGYAPQQFPQQGGYPPQGNYPQQGGYPPQQGNYPQQGGYPPQQGNYPQQGGYPPQQGNYPQQGGYPPQQGNYPQQGGYPPQQGNYPQQGGYPPQQGNYPQQGGYPPQQGNYPGYPPQPGNYPPQGQGGEPPAGPTMGSLPPRQ